MPNRLHGAVHAAVLVLGLGVLMAGPVRAAEPPEREPHVMIAFLPQNFDTIPGVPLLPEFGRLDGVALGLSSPILGQYSRQQVLLDISAGSRISTRTYPDELGPLFLRRHGDRGQTAGWNAAMRRGAAAPGEIVPGLLATTVQRHGGHVAYAGVEGSLQGESIVATNEEGEVERASVAGPESLKRRALDLLEDHELVVARLPRRAAGRRALGQILAGRRPQDMVYVMVAPNLSFGLLPTAVSAPGFTGLLTSPTTRREGLVTTTDIAPTALNHLGIVVPREMQGQPASSVSFEGARAEYLDGLNARQEVVTDRRIPALLLLLGAWLVVLAALGAVARGDGLRLGFRVGFLALLWLPSLALLTAALEPRAAAEYAILALGSLALGAITDRLLRWPAGALAPAVVLLIAHTIDLANNSALIVNALTGPTPRGGARFFGIGNELETILTVSVLLGTGSLLALRPTRWAPWIFGATALATAIVVGAGRLGADVGGVITIGAGAAVAVLASLPGGPSRKAIGLAILAPVAALGLLIAIDIVTGGDAHLTRFVLDASGPGQLWDTAVRRLELAGSILISGTTPFSVAALAGVIIWGLLRRDRLLAPMRAAIGQDAARLYAAGVYGTIGALVFGSLANDSGPRIFLVGSVAALLAAAYGWSAPQSPRRAD